MSDSPLPPKGAATAAAEGPPPTIVGAISSSTAPEEIETERVDVEPSVSRGEAAARGGDDPAAGADEVADEGTAVIGTQTLSHQSPVRQLRITPSVGADCCARTPANDTAEGAAAPINTCVGIPAVNTNATANDSNAATATATILSMPTDTAATSDCSIHAFSDLLSPTLLALVRDETALRVDIEALEALDRPQGDPHSISNYDEWVARTFHRRREEILASEDFNGLITRQFLRRERWLDYTLRRTAALIQQEEDARNVLREHALHSFTPFMRWRLNLDTIATQGTEGTAIGVEEEERNARIFNLLHAEEEAFVEVFTFQFQREAVAAEERCVARLERESEEKGVIEAAEENARYHISESFWLSWPQLLEKEAQCRGEVILIVAWQIVTAECKRRYAIEAEEANIWGISCRGDKDAEELEDYEIEAEAVAAEEKERAVAAAEGMGMADSALGTMPSGTPVKGGGGAVGGTSTPSGATETSNSPSNLIEILRKKRRSTLTATDAAAAANSSNSKTQRDSIRELTRLRERNGKYVLVDLAEERAVAAAEDAEEEALLRKLYQHSMLGEMRHTKTTLLDVDTNAQQSNTNTSASAFSAAVLDADDLLEKKKSITRQFKREMRAILAEKRRPIPPPLTEEELAVEALKERARLKRIQQQEQSALIAAATATLDANGRGGDQSISILTLNTTTTTNADVSNVSAASVINTTTAMSRVVIRQQQASSAVDAPIWPPIRYGDHHKWTRRPPHYSGVGDTPAPSRPVTREEAGGGEWGCAAAEERAVAGAAAADEPISTQHGGVCEAAAGVNAPVGAGTKPISSYQHKVGPASSPSFVTAVDPSSPFSVAAKGERQTERRKDAGGGHAQESYAIVSCDSDSDGDDDGSDISPEALEALRQEVADGWASLSS